MIKLETDGWTDWEQKNRWMHFYKRKGRLEERRCNYQSVVRMDGWTCRLFTIQTFHLHVIQHVRSINVCLLCVCVCPEGRRLHRGVCAGAVLTWLNIASSFPLHLFHHLLHLFSRPSLSPTQHFWEREREGGRRKRERKREEGWAKGQEPHRDSHIERQRQRSQSYSSERERSVWYGLLWYDVMSILAFIPLTVAWPLSHRHLQAWAGPNPPSDGHRNTFRQIVMGWQKQSTNKSETPCVGDPADSFVTGRIDRQLLPDLKQTPWNMTLWKKENILISFRIVPKAAPVFHPAMMSIVV